MDDNILLVFLAVLGIVWITCQVLKQETFGFFSNDDEDENEVASQGDVAALEAVEALNRVNPQGPMLLPVQPTAPALVDGQTTYTEEQMQALLGGFQNNPSCGTNDVPNLMDAQKMVWNYNWDEAWIYNMYGWTAGNRGRINNIM